MNSTRPEGATWPPHQVTTVPWAQTARGGTKEDRTLSSIEASLPPHIARAAVPISPNTLVEMESALRDIAVLDRSAGPELTALGALLIRSESVASSKIEDEEASVEDYARALHGHRGNRSASSMVDATAATEYLMLAVAERKRIDLDLLTNAHERLMAADPTERGYAGKVRDMQNWIGGSNYSPRGALYVPPPPSTVADYLEDLLDFTNRRDLPVLAQAAIAHAQFESIHPFTDGNGRIGRALMNAILRCRGATSTVVVPIASGLVGNRDRYFSYLDSYRGGDIEPLLLGMAHAVRMAASESLKTAQRLSDLPSIWRDAAGRVRRGSTTDQVLARLERTSVFTTDELAATVSGPTSSVYTAVERLRAVGILRPLTERTRNQVWGVAAVLDELDDLELRIRAATREA